LQDVCGLPHPEAERADTNSDGDVPVAVEIVK
jgi:hypothetical protein